MENNQIDYANLTSSEIFNISEKMHNNNEMGKAILQQIDISWTTERLMDAKNILNNMLEDCRKQNIPVQVVTIAINKINNILKQKGWTINDVSNM